MGGDPTGKGTHTEWGSAVHTLWGVPWATIVRETAVLATVLEALELGELALGGPQ